MPLNKDIKKVLVIGSGPIIIGQAAEFDYSGTQACQSLKEEGIEVVLVNSNPATIMTDAEIADKIYIEPITLEFVEKIIEKERPDSLLAGMGGQTGLNMAVELHDSGVLEKYGVKVIGTSIDSIKKGEDRELFRYDEGNRPAGNRKRDNHRSRFRASLGCQGRIPCNSKTCIYAWRLRRRNRR